MTHLSLRAGDHAVAPIVHLLVALAWLAGATPRAQAQKPPEPDQQAWDPEAVYKVPIEAAPQLGEADALVTIVELADFQCPFTRRAQTTLEMVRALYGRDVRVVLKHNPLPFHPEALLAAQASVEAHAQGNGWAFDKLMFGHQQALEQADLEAYAERAGLAVAKLRSALEAGTHEGAVLADQRLARSLGASGTPAFYVNGRFLRGAQPLLAFTQLIDTELAKARARVDQGTPRERVYEETIARGATAPRYLQGAAAAAELARTNKMKERQGPQVIAVPADAPRVGAVKPVVLVQFFGDFACPFSKRAQATLTKLLHDHGEHVQVVWHHLPLPFHRDALLAAEAAVEINRQKGAQAFWRYREILFDNHANLTLEALVQHAKALSGIDTARLTRALETREHRARVIAEYDQTDRAFPSPTFLINEKPFYGALPYATIEQAVSEAIALGDPPHGKPVVLVPASAKAIASYGSKAVDENTTSLLERACERGAGSACTELADQFLDGEGVKPSPARAARLFAKGCDLGDADGCFGIAYAYDTGEGIAKNARKAAKLYDKGCDAGIADACLNLAILHRDGVGVARSEEKSDALFDRACRLGSDAPVCRIPTLVPLPDTSLLQPGGVQLGPKLQLGR